MKNYTNYKEKLKVREQLTSDNAGVTFNMSAKKYEVWYLDYRNQLQMLEQRFYNPEKAWERYGSLQLIEDMLWMNENDFQNQK